MHANGWKVGGGGHDVVRHLAIDHPSFVPDNIFVKSKADALCYTTFNLAGSQNRINDAPNLLHGDKVSHACFAGTSVHLHLRDIHGPRIGGIGVASVGLIIPVDSGWRSVYAVAFQRSMLKNVLSACRPEFFGRVALAEETTIDQGVSHRRTRRFDQLANDHAGPRSYRRTAVRHLRSIRLDHFDAVKSDAERLRRNLAKNGIGALAHFGTRGQHSDLAFVGSLDGNNCAYIAFARSGEASSVHEGCATNPTLYVSELVFARESLALRAIVAQFERAIQELSQVHRLMNDLAGG